MGRPITPIGTKFGDLTLVARVGAKHWQLSCACGGSKTALKGNVLAGRTVSCGCAQRRAARVNGAITKTHGMTHTDTYHIWSSMKSRCHTPSHGLYKKYGARGITVCQRWLDGFENFLADMGPRPSGMSIDRIDGRLGYFPENCRWATAVEQNNNRRSVPLYSFNGMEKTVTQWADHLGISRHVLRNRIRAGWPLKAAFTTSVNKNLSRPKRAQAVRAAIGGV